MFDGSRATAYSEKDEPVPLGLRGQALWRIEQSVRAACPQHVLLRFGWLLDESIDGVLGRFLTRAEYHALMEAMPAQHRPLTALLFGSGLRWSEATALRPGDIGSGPPPMARVRRAWKRTPGKGMHLGPPKSVKSRRAAVLSVEAYDLLEPLLDRPPTSLLFTAPRGGMLHHGDWRERVWVPACRAAGLASPPAKGVRYDGPGIHDARHTHASWLLSTGQVTLEMLQDQLGHESILTTRKVYAALIPETRNRLAEALRSLATDPPVPLLDGPDHV